MTLLAPGRAAEYYAAAGWCALPVWWAEDGRCACKSPRCSSPAKHPIAEAVPNGCRGATKDAETIRRWWGKWPKANVAIATGSASGVWVLDVDPEGLGPWQALRDQFGEVPTLTAKTGRGGLHLVFRLPAGAEVRNSAGVVAKGVDVRGEGGYVLVEPSVNLAGPYGWFDVDLEADDLRGAIIEAPGWLLGLLERGSNSGSASAPALNGELEGVPEGQRNATAARIAGSLFARGIDHAMALLTLRGWNAGNKPPLPADELRKVVDSMWRTDNIRHPERKAERAELALLDEQVAAERAKLAAAQQGVALQAVADQGAAPAAPAAAPAGVAQTRQQRLAFLRAALGVPIDRWLRVGTTAAQYVLVTDSGDRLPIGTVDRVLSPALFAAPLFDVHKVVMPRAGRKVWQQVLEALCAIVEDEDGGATEGEEILAAIYAAAEEHGAIAGLSPDITPELRETYEAEAMRHGQPFRRGDEIYFATPWLADWMRRNGYRTDSAALRAALQRCAFRNTKLSRRSGGVRIHRHFWIASVPGNE